MSEYRASSTLEEIPREECLQLVATLSIGRIAAVSGDGPPLVVPVNYVLDGDCVVFRSDPGSKLSSLRRRPVSFQVDQIDPAHRTGWSVLIQGAAFEGTAAEAGDVEVQSWAPGEKRHWVRIVPSAITGRRIRLPELPPDRRGYL